MIEEKIIGNYRIEIYQDENPESPREWENIGIMMCFHRGYNLGDAHSYRYDHYSSWKEMQRDIYKNEDVAVMYPLYLYDHSGLSISTTPFHCSWDSGQVGWIFATKQRLRKEYNCKRITSKIIGKASKYLEQEVKTYDMYLRGDIYGYKIFNIAEEEEIDSCWGFYGIDDTFEAAEQYINFLNK